MRLCLLSAVIFTAVPIFAANYAKPGEISALFATESALSYTVYLANGEKKDYTLKLQGDGAQKTFRIGQFQGLASLSKGSLTLTIGGKEAAVLKPRVFSGGLFFIWVQAAPFVRYAVPSSFLQAKDAALLRSLKGEMDALAPFTEESGYAEEGE